MSLHFAFAQAAGEGPQPPSTPLIMLPPPNAPSMRRAVTHKSCDRDCHAKRRLTKDRWLVTSDGEPIGRIKRIVRRPDDVRRVCMVYGRRKDIVEFHYDRGKCAETGEGLVVRRLV